MALFAEALPTGTLTLSAKQADNLDRFAKSFLGEDAKGLFGVIKGLLAKGKERVLSVTSKEAASGVGKDLTLAVTEGAETVSKIETNSSFLGEIAEALQKIKSDRLKKEIQEAFLKKDLASINKLVAETFSKLTSSTQDKISKFISQYVDKGLAIEDCENLIKGMSLSPESIEQAFKASLPTEEILKKAFPHIWGDLIEKILNVGKKV